MSASAAMVNGRPRKQLSEQLDRLDSIIDGLCDGLPRAVADAARDGTRLAVRDAILEVMTNPELRALIQNLAPASAAPAADVSNAPVATPPGLWSRIKAKVAASKTAVVEHCRAAKEAVTNTTRTLSALMPLRRILLVALGVGAAVTVLSFIAPAGVTAVLAGVGGVVTAAVAQVGSWFRRSLNFTRNT